MLCSVLCILRRFSLTWAEDGLARAAAIAGMDPICAKDSPPECCVTGFPLGEHSNARNACNGRQEKSTACLPPLILRSASGSLLNS